LLGGNSENDKDLFGGDFLRKKSYDEALIDKEDFQDFLKKHAKKVKNKDIDLIKKTFIDPTKQKLDQEQEEVPETEETTKTNSKSKYTFKPPGWGSQKDNSFLMNYIVNRKWLENRDIFQDERWKKVDEEDNWYHEAAEEKEHAFNMRFELGGYKEGNKEVKRDMDTQRMVKQSKRKTGRDLKIQRKEEELERLKKEKELLKDLKKEKMRGNVMKLIKESGKQNVSECVIEQLLENAMQRSEAEALDYLMEKLFNEHYFEENEKVKEDDMLKYLKEVEENFDVSDEDESEVELKDEEVENFEEKQEEEKVIQPELPTPIANQIWWYCDICKKGIQPQTYKFECPQCPDFTSCKKCERLADHPHKLTKSKVPVDSVPPSDDQILQLLNLQKTCIDCNEKVFNEIGYYVYKENNEEFYYCEDCKTTYEEEDKFEYVSNRVNRIDQDLKGDGMREKLKDILHEGMGGEETEGYEYVDVKPDSFGLTDSELLYADERILNQMISTKRMVTYKEIELSGRDKVRIRKMRNSVRKSAEINKKLTTKIVQLNEEGRALKLLSKKSKKGQKDYDRFLESKEATIAKYERKAQMDQDRICVMLGMKIKEKPNQNIELETTAGSKNVSESSDSLLKVSSKRLSYYNLK
jgi:protein KRI1